jgi:hypothetical protein
LVAVEACGSRPTTRSLSTAQVSTTDSLDQSRSLKPFTDSLGLALHGSVLGSFTVGSPTPGALYNDGLFGAPVAITAGSYYYLEVTSNSDFSTNYFYNWNGSPQVNLGDVTILDGGQGGDPTALTNTVAPALLLDIQTVPEPASFAVLGIGALAMVRRRRSSK